MGLKYDTGLYNLLCLVVQDEGIWLEFVLII